MNCTTCKHRYIRGGWICWSGNKKSIGKCNDGNPSDDRIRAMSDEELAEWASAITLDEFGDKKDWLDWLRQEVNQNEGSDILNA